LTTIANAPRVGDHLLKRLGAPSAAHSETNEFPRLDTHTLPPHATER
jgi:hypothetical protein